MMIIMCCAQTPAWDSVFAIAFVCFSGIKNLLGRTDTQTRERIQVLSVDTNSLRHLPRQSSKNCDLQFANIFKDNYSI